MAIGLKERRCLHSYFDVDGREISEGVYILRPFPEYYFFVKEEEDNLKIYGAEGREILKKIDLRD